MNITNFGTSDMTSFEAKEYNPPRFLRNGHLATVYPVFFRKQAKPNYQRERITTPDDDFFDVDCLKQESDTLVLLLHGLEGGSDSQYIMSASSILYEHGYDIAAINYRSCSGETNKQLRVYHAGCTDDVDTCISYFEKNYSKIYIVGYSLSGNIGFNYVGGFNVTPHPKVKGIVGVSMPLDLNASTRQIQQFQNLAYDNRFVVSLRQKAQLKHKQYPEFYSQEKIRKVKRLYDFDNLFTGPANGYSGATEYYNTCSCINVLGNVTIPALMVNAQDDPFLPAECYLSNRLDIKHTITSLEPKYGGHVGFGSFRARYYWIDQTILDFVTLMQNKA